MAKRFNNKRHNDLTKRLVGMRSVMNYMNYLGRVEVIKGGRSPEEFSEKAVFNLGKDSYNQKIEKYEQGFESGDYVKTDLPYSQRVAHNIGVINYELNKKK